MKLIREVANNPHAPRRYLLLERVMDEDAIILELCNMIRAPQYDETNTEDGIIYEAWAPMDSLY